MLAKQLDYVQLKIFQDKIFLDQQDLNNKINKKLYFKVELFKNYPRELYHNVYY